jgi:hypothetical protein
VLRGKGRQETLEMGSSERIIRLLSPEVSLDQIMGNWYHFFKPIHRIKNLLTVKEMLNVVPYFIAIIFLKGLCKPLF